MDIKYYQYLAQKVLAGVASAEEKAALQAFIESGRDQPDIMQALFPVQELENMPSKSLPAEMEERVLSSIREPRPHTLLRRAAFWTRISAAAAVLIFVCYIAYQWRNRSEGGPHKPFPLAAVVTRPGEHQLVTLTDGSQVLLNGNSRLHFPQKFDAVSRTVYLEGEAFFTVSQDERRPFIVRTAGLSTTVLGTSFNVRSFDTESTTHVAVATGKVRVALEDSVTGIHPAIEVTPGERVSYRLHSVTGLQKERIGVAMIGAWKERTFFYDQTPLRQILADLESVYGLRFKVADTALLQCTYTARFRNLTAASMLNSLARLGEVHFTTKDSLITVSGKPCQ